MFLSAEVISLILYCAQQLGVALGVGAQTIMLVAYISAMRDGVVDDKEAQFARAVRGVLMTGLSLIIVSGLGITALHILGGQTDTIFSQAYLFKWLLIIGVFVCTLLKNLPQHVMQGLAGGSWSALFVVHILAPVATWPNLLTLYAVWMIGFGICWSVLVLLTRGKTSVQSASIRVTQVKAPAVIKIVNPAVSKPPAPPPPVPKPVPPPPPPPPKPIAVAPKPIPPPLPLVTPKPPPVAPPPVNLPVLEQKHILQTLPQPDASKPAPAVVKKEEQNPWLPAIHVMPKTQIDADKQTNHGMPPPPK